MPKFIEGLEDPEHSAQKSGWLIIVGGTLGFGLFYGLRDRHERVDGAVCMQAGQSIDVN